MDTEYLCKRNLELIALLTDDSTTPTEKFWNVAEETKKEAKILRTCLDGHSRSKMVEFIFLMLRYKMLTIEDLEVFSEEVRAQAQSILDMD